MLFVSNKFIPVRWVRRVQNVAVMKEAGARAARETHRSVLSRSRCSCTTRGVCSLTEMLHWDAVDEAPS